jgi:hypothetical protein
LDHTKEYVVRVAFATDPAAVRVSAFSDPSDPAVQPAATSTPASVTAQMGADAGEVDVTVTQRTGRDDSVVIEYTDDTTAPFTWTTVPGGPFTDGDMPVTVTGLVPGTGYLFQARTESGSFESPWVETSGPTLARPDAPTVVHQAGDASAYFQVTVNSVAQPTSYLVTSDPEGLTCSVEGASGWCVVDGLTNDDTYSFTVVATYGSFGESLPRIITGVVPSSDVLVPPFAPEPPVSVSGNDGVIVEAPVPPGGGPLDKVVVTAYDTATPPNEVGSCEFEPPVESCFIPNLPPGDYVLKAKSEGPEDADGNRPTSSESLPVEVTVAAPDPNNPLPDLPGVPSVAVTAGNTQLTVTVTADGSGSVGAPDSYTVVARGVNPAVAPGMCTVEAPDTSCVITGLVNGTTYEVSARAENAGGFSGFTDPAVTGTPTNPEPPPVPPLPSRPSAPGSVTATAGIAVATVTWTPATAPADAPIISYRAVASPGGASCTAPATATTCTITGLTNGTTYTVSVAAINAGGLGAAATSNPVTPTSQPPARPDRPGVAAGNGQVNVTVVPGSGGGPASSYTATASPGGASCTVNAPATTCAITGLTNGTAYTVTTTATNAAGTSAASPASVSVTPRGDLPEAPAKPGQPTAVAGDSSATVTVTPGTGGGAVDRFTVTASPGGATCTVTTPATSCEITGLRNGTAYTFTSIAVNAGGSSAPSDASAPVTPQVEAPAPPASVKVMPGDEQATVMVTPGDGGGPVDRYVVTASPGGATCTITPPARACVVRGLDNGTDYTFAVRAVNAGGSTPAPEPTDPVTPEPAIDPTPVPLVDPPAPGQTQAMEDGQPITDVTVAPDRMATGLTVSTNTFTLAVEGVDRRGRPVGLQSDRVLLMVDNGRARTQGTGFRPGSTVRVFLGVPVIGDGSMLRIGATSVMDLGRISVDDLGDFLGTVPLPADLKPGEYVLQVTGVTTSNGERAVSLGVRVVENNATITLVKGKRVSENRRLDRVRSTGTSTGVPAGTKLVPYVRFGNRGAFTQGRATIIVREDGSFRWTRKVGKTRQVQAYVTFASAQSNTVKWARLR